MVKKLLPKFLVLLVILGLSNFHTFHVQAATGVSVTADKDTATVYVTISDSSLVGKEISVTCRNPQWDGGSTDFSYNQSSIVYTHQYKVESTSTKINFRVKDQPVQGEYALVIGSEKGRVVHYFRFFKVQDPTPAPPATVATPATPAIKKLSTPNSPKAVVSGTTKVTLTWSKVDGAKAYTVYRSSKASTGFKKIGTSTTNKYRDKKATLGKIWYYKVAATGDASDVNSKKSKAVKVLVLRTPSIKVTSTVKGSVTVTWKPVKGAKGYKVYVATKKSGKYSQKLSLKGVSKVKGKVNKLKKGKTYYIKVRAYTKVGRKNVLGNYSSVKTVKVRKKNKIG